MDPFRIQLYERLGSRRANLFGIRPAERLSRLDKSSQVSGCRSCPHPSQRLDCFHAKIVGALRQNVSFGQAQELRRRCGVAAHSDLVERQRQNHGIDFFEQIREELTTFGRSGDGELAYDCVVKSAPAVTQPLRQKIVQTFLTVDQNADGRKYLENVKSERFVGMNDKDYDIIREVTN